MLTPESDNATEAGVQYSYLPIFSTTQQPAIRLLVVFAGLPQDPLLGVFVQETLDFTADQEPFWTAVSYTWGNQTPSEILLIDDRYLPFTSNVTQIVRDLREPNRHIIVWIDAVCINQNDAEEKVSQLEIMRRIYEQAKEVVIWLRPSEQVSVTNLIMASQWLDEKMINQDHEVSKLPLDLAFRQDHPSLKWDEPFHRVATSEWFQRIWVIQEAVVAKNLWLYIEHERITWDLVCSATLRFLSGYDTERALKETLDQCCISGLLKDYSRAISNTISMLRLIHRLRASWQDHTFHLVPSEVVHLCRHQKTSLAADMIYGLMGLFVPSPFSTSSVSLEINYGQRSFHAYQRFAIWCMETERNLDVVTQLRNESGQSPWGPWDYLPLHSSSWVGKWDENRRTDFTTSTDMNLGPVRQPAVAPIPSNIRMFRTMKNILVLRGFIIDTFKSAFPIMEGKSTDVSLNWLGNIPDDPKANFVLFDEERPTAETLERKLIRTMEREPVSSHLWRDGQLPTPPRQGISGDWRFAFMTSRGCLAINYSYVDLELPSVICAVYGARALLALAPKKRQYLDKSQYSLISGDCFIDGFEDGLGIGVAQKLGLKEEDIEIA